MLSLAIKTAHRFGNWVISISEAQTLLFNGYVYVRLFG